MAGTTLKRTPRVTVSAYFLAAGVGLGAWAASLPALSVRGDLDKGELGIVLLSFAAGAIIAMTSTGNVVARRGTAFVCIPSALTCGIVLLAVPYVASSCWGLMAAIFIGGGAFGALDVAMNTEASFIERQINRHIMSSFHAVFSFGNLIGAGASAQLLRSGGTMDACLIAGAASVFALTAFAWRRAPVAGRGGAAPAQEGGGAPGFDAGQNRLLWLLGGLAFLTLLSEGALMDWSAIYLVSSVGTTESAGALGFAIFAAAMAISRGLGDLAVRRLGPVRLLRYGAGMTALALGGALLLKSHAATYVALAFCGIGIANVVPIIFSAAGRIGGEAAGPAMSRVTAMGYAGLLVGPPLIGFLAEATSLTISLTTIVVFACVVAVGARLTATR